MTKTVEDITEVLGKWCDEKLILPFAMPKTIPQIEKVLHWYYGSAGYTKADIETAQHILDEKIGDQTGSAPTKKRGPSRANRL